MSTVQLRDAAAAPKEMPARSGEMVEEVLSPGQPIVADPEVLEQIEGSNHLLIARTQI